MASLASLIALQLDTDIPAVVNANTNRNIFIGGWPAHPDTAIRIMDYSGMEFDRVMGVGSAGIAVANHRIQTMVRAINLEDGDALIKLVFGSLDNFVGVIGGVRFLHIIAVHPPSMIGVDETKRFLWTCNFQIKKELS
jgi:hypothetical protein